MEVGGAPNVLDVVLALLLVVALLRGWRRGAVLQIGGFAGLALGLLAGAWAAARIAGLVMSGPGPGAGVLTLGVLLVALVLGQAVGVASGLRLGRVVHRSGAARVDRAAGVGVGGAGFLLVVCTTPTADWVTTRAAGLGEPTGVLPDPADPGALLVAE